MFFSADIKDYLGFNLIYIVIIYLMYLIIPPFLLKLSLNSFITYST